MRQVLLYPGEGGMWVASCPSLPGCISQGATREDAVANIQEAIALYVESLKADGLAVPPDHLDATLVVLNETAGPVRP